MVKVSFLDLRAQYETIRLEIAESMQRVLESAAFVGGQFVEEFEKDFATFCGCSHAVGVSSGTSALWATLVCLGIGPGDEVITVPNTFIATAEAISLCGARPVFVDVDDESYTMDPRLLERAISKRTKAVIPVHLYGQPADMDPILDVAAGNNIYVIEDACQAHGALYKGRAAGSMGTAGCFSFYPGKNLGAYGEAGAVVTNDAALAEKIRMFRDHGQSRKYYHDMIGWNSRMDGFQGAVLSVKLKHLAGWNEMRRRRAALYGALLKGAKDLVLPREMDYARHVYHIYAIRTKYRSGLMFRLAEKGIACLIHYPVPIHLQEAYRQLGLEMGVCPVAEKCAGELLSLPMYPELAREQIDYVAGEIRAYLGSPSNEDMELCESGTGERRVKGRFTI